jgi:FAD binding domain/Berberine and berberine like
MGYRQVGPPRQKTIVVTSTAILAQTVNIDPEALQKLGLSPRVFLAFEQSLTGRIVVPGMPDYDADRVSNPLFQEFPKIIVYCATIADVQVCLEYARRYGWWVVSRSGGHSTAGFSVNSGIVIDLSQLSYLSVDPEHKIATGGAGTTFARFNRTLDLYRLHVPGGGCPDVGVAGYMQGGGYGFTSRTYGMNCDNVVEITMMTADGRMVIASERRNPDLFWAVRGGTGNQFGILLEIKYRLYDWKSGWGFALVWDTEHSPAALAEMQRNYMKNSATDQVGFMAGIGMLNGAATAMMFGIYIGERSDGMQAIQSLLEIGPPQFMVDEVSPTYSKLDNDIMGFLPGPGTPGTLEIKTSQYIGKPMSESDWAQVVEYFARNNPNSFNIGFIEAYGGAIHRYPKDGNAFIHREVDMQFDIDAFWNSRWPNSTEAQARQFLDGATAILRRHWDGHQYQNYPRRNDVNYRWEYWGDAFNDLLFVKDKYDPKRFFHYEQSISAYPDQNGITRSTRPSRFNDPRIEYGPGA